MTKSYHELLREVRDSLTQDNWDKDCYYFSNKNNNLCMSIHGAAQKLVNPQVVEIFEKNNVLEAVHYHDRRGETGARIACCDDATYANNSHLSTWINRPYWVKEDFVYNNKNCGNLNLHFLMGMFGLTYGFENQKSTTLDMIQEKLSEAAMWAEENEEFLVKN